MFAVGAAYKKMFASENFPPLPSQPRQKKIMAHPLMSLARANHSLGSVSKIWIPVREGTGTFEKRNAGRYQKTYSENLLWMMNYLWLWILLKAQHCKDLICHRWRMSWSWICLHKLRAFSGYAPLPCPPQRSVLPWAVAEADSFGQGVGGEWILLDVAVRVSIAQQRQCSPLAQLNPMVHPCSLLLMSQKCIKPYSLKRGNLPKNDSPLNFFRLSLIERSLKAVISQKKVQEIPLSCVQNTNN